MHRKFSLPSSFLYLHVPYCKKVVEGITFFIFIKLFFDKAQMEIAVYVFRSLKLKLMQIKIKQS